MKVIKATFAKDFRNIEGENLFDKHHVICVMARCTTHGEYTGYIFGEPENVDALLNATPTSWRKLHFGGKSVDDWKSYIPHGLQRYNDAINEGIKKGWIK